MVTPSERDGGDSASEPLVGPDGLESGVADPSDVMPLPVGDGAASVADDDESEFPVARAIPGVFATATPMPSATASAPTRPTYLA